MRIKFAVVLFVLLTVSLTGQEEPLPAVVTRSEPTVILAVEPIRETAAPSTLAGAARANDYATFHALYLESKDARYAMLDELWTYAMTDPIGAFYGAEMHDRLAAMYPDYAKFIAEQAITDANGVVFYPTSETRAFLLAHAGQHAAPAPAPAPAVRERKPKGAEARARVAPVSDRPVIARIPKSAPEVRTTPVPAESRPEVAAPHVEPPQAAPVVAVPDSNGLASRGILLLVIGLIGIGLLAVIVRTPREEPLEKPEAKVDNVEPIRRPAVPDETPRATGSHG